METSNWQAKSIDSLYGVGAVRQKAYARLGVHTMGELLEHYPRAYENRGDVCLLAAAPTDGALPVHSRAA